jgi:heptosyltransferase-2
VSPAFAYALGEPLFRILRRRLKSVGRTTRPPERILVLRLDGIGDIVLTSPFLRQVRRAWPDAWITLVVLPYVANIVQNCPYINEVLVFDPEVSGRVGMLRLHLRAISFAVRKLLPRNFDLSINPRWGTPNRNAN